VDWLNALVFEMATRRMLFSQFTVHIEDGRRQGQAVGEAVDMARHRPTVEIKGAELHGGEDPDGCRRAQCVVDV